MCPSGSSPTTRGPATFLVADGVIPSNEGRGYVLRKILRRALRHGKKLGLEKPFLKDLVGVVCAEMGQAFPEIVENRKTIETVLLMEEESFASTISVGLKRLLEVTAALTPPSDKEIPGDALFKLYDTFGFPMDLAEDVAKEQGLTLDLAGFEACMEKQRELARASWKGEMETQDFRGLSEARCPHPLRGLHRRCALKARAAFSSSREANVSPRPPQATRWSSSSTGRPSMARAAARWGMWD